VHYLLSQNTSENICDALTDLGYATTESAINYTEALEQIDE